MIINGSPRVQKLSNTDKILTKLIEGMKEADPELTYEMYCISDRKQWDPARAAFECNNVILIALPLYFECVPGLLLEFLGTLSPKHDDTKISFVLQSGFAEASQLRCGEEFLSKLPSKLGCTYGGTLIKGDNFSFRYMNEEQTAKPLGAYKTMGGVYIKNGGFDCEEARKFAGPEYFGFFLRGILTFVFNVFARKGFEKMAEGQGCTKPLAYRPYD